MSWADVSTFERQVLEDARQRCPEIIPLAQVLSLSTRIEPLLLRNARLYFFGDVATELESLLWFSPLVDARSSTEIVLHAGSARMLADELRNNDLSRYVKVRDFTREHTRHWSPEERLEQDLRHLTLDEDEVSFNCGLQDMLKRIWREDKYDQRIKLARWVQKCLPQLIDKEQMSDEAQWLLQYAAHSLGGTAAWTDVINPQRILPSWLENKVPGFFDQTNLALELRQNPENGYLVMTFLAPEEGKNVIEFPTPLPAKLHVAETEGGEGVWHAVAVNTCVPISSEVYHLRLTTVDGQQYVLQSKALPLSKASSPWHRLEIIEDAGLLRFVYTTDRVRAEETLATGQLALVDSFLRSASRDPGQNSEVAKTLFEMLLPPRRRELSPQQGNLVVIVDRQSACYPWELLENRWATSERPPAVAAGLVRQFRTIKFRQPPVHGLGNTALVVGNPDLQGSANFADLPGARDEAQQVAEQLAAEAYDVLDCIDQAATPIMESLHKNSWRILHLAGHGVHEYPTAAGKVSGMVIGPDNFLTPGDIAQMRFVPEVVFVNCCHLGRVDGQRDLDRLGLAANLGEEFIRMGVRAVIAAGWAVDDRAGQAFATTFYRRMLAGEYFGEAVRAAREEIWSRFPDVNTWGAYQCYGEPNYQFYIR